MRDSDSGNDAARTLKRMLKDAGLRSFRLDGSSRAIVFPGRTREWLVLSRLRPDWLCVGTTICQVPNEASLRARLLEHAMALNRSMNLLKFGAVEGNLVLEIDYRTEHVDAAALGSLVGLLVSAAEDHYPPIFRVVSGDQTLKALEQTLAG